MSSKYNCPIPEQYLRAYVLGGKAIFTLFSEKTKLRYTFKVLAPKGKQEWYRIERLFGDDNTKDYRTIGVFTIKDDLVYTRFNHYGSAESQIKYFLNVLYGSLKWPPTMYMYPSGRCARCGRLLTTPESIETGFGPKCIGKV